MEDIEFLQHCGGMNPGERFYKMAPHLKPNPSMEDTKKYYYNMFSECCGFPAPFKIPDSIVKEIEAKAKRKKKKTEQPNFIIAERVEIYPGVYMDKAVYEKMRADYASVPTMDEYLDALADEIRREYNGKAYSEKDSCDIQERQSKILS